jgi:hypothetical protein
MGQGAVISFSRKQGMNTRSSTEAELVAADEVAGTRILAKLFLKAQAYGVLEIVLYHDNRSAIRLEKNGRESGVNDLVISTFECFLSLIRFKGASSELSTAQLMR